MEEQRFSQLARDVLESMFGFIATDKDGNVIYISEQAQRELGKSYEQCVGQHIENVFPEIQMHRALNEQESVIRKSKSAHGPDVMQSILPIYRNGDQTSGELVGAMCFLVRENASKFVPEGKKKSPEQLSDKQAEDGLEELLGQSRRIKEVKSLIRRIANTTVAVCILGETGTGKELVADAIHKLSGRATKPFVKINCAAIPKDLMESELFGYEPGAFTSASRRGKIGKFELADGGTLLLDEIGELPLNLQAKLLRVIQAGEVERVGGITPIPINVRLICSTNRNLQQMVKAGIFRDDLYYRINVMEVTVPPLRERLEDISFLIDHFIDAANQKHKLSVHGVDPQTGKMLQSYSWPGNVRELEHCIERACVLCGTGYLTSAHFSSLPIEDCAPNKQSDKKMFENSFRSQRHDAEAEIILKAIEACQGNKTKAAEMLNITRATLYSKLKKHGLII